MAEIKVPIQVNLPDDWVEQIVDRLRNDPDAEWVEIIRCKDCKFLRLTGNVWKCQNRLVMMLCEPNDYCSRAERRSNE